MAWTTPLVATVPVDLYIPSSIRFALLSLHDQSNRTLLDDPVWTPLLETLGVVCVCPHGGNTWWSNRLERSFDKHRSAERYLIEEIVPWIQNSFRSHIAIAGAEMGGQGALRLAFKHPQMFRVTAALDAAVDHYELHGSGTSLDGLYESREQCRQDSALLHIQPAKQPTHILFAADPRSRWYRGNDRLHEKLGALGVAHRFETNRTLISPKFVLEYIQAGMEQESRRLM